MNDRQFDRLTRQVGQQSTRRTMVKTAIGGALALLGLARVAGHSESKNNNRSNQTGYEDDECATSDDCRSGLRCEGARTGIAPGFPTPIEIPVITGQSGTCRYRQGCGGEQGDACRRTDDCCSGETLTCDNNRCKRR